MKMAYNDLKKVIKILKSRIGKDKIHTSDTFLTTYGYDATGETVKPDIVAIPDCDQDVAEILRIAYSYRIPITPRGAGVGYSGGAVPVEGGIVLVFTRMNRILEINEKNYSVTVEPGVVTWELQQAVEALGLYYPPDPASLKTSTIGGNVAENAGGPRCFKYGVTGNYVLGLEAYLVDGTKIKTGSPIIKDVAGYNLKSLLIGSEGTLAVVTRIILRLIPKPDIKKLFRIDFKTMRAGADFIHLILKENVSPSVLEFLDKSSITAAAEYLEMQISEEIGASLIIELDGNHRDVEHREGVLRKLLSDDRVLSWMEASGEADEEQIWILRRNVSPAIATLKPKKVNEDIVVPIATIPEAVDFINTTARELDLIIILFGHFGDGNIHTNIMVDPENSAEMERSEIALDRIFRFVIGLGGAISGEHGIGIAKKRFMSLQFSDAEMKLFSGIKNAFDPKGLLNPGKII